MGVKRFLNIHKAKWRKQIDYAESEVLHGNQLRFHTSSSILVVRL